MWNRSLLLRAALVALLTLWSSPAPSADDEDLEVVELPPSADSDLGGLRAEPLSCDEIREIQIFKASRVLMAFCRDGGGLATRVALGREESGPKRSGRDNRTPEGFYRTVGRARASQKYHLFIPIDYPSEADAERGLAVGSIDERTHRAILAAHDHDRMPPPHTALGGHLGFHGEGPRWEGDSISINWTYGCIAVDDELIEFLADRMPPGTPVIIRP